MAARRSGWSEVRYWRMELAELETMKGTITRQSLAVAARHSRLRLSSRFF
jgi:hypothetical protein